MVKTTLTIDGMACSMCEAHVCEALRKAAAVKKVRASHKKGMAELLTEEPVSEAAVRKSVEETGYRVLDVSSEPYVKKGLFGW
jgi:copper chaperone CopZ